MKIDTTGWKEFRVGDLFDKRTIKGVPKSDENLQPNDDGYHIFGQNIQYQYPQKILLDEKYLQVLDEPIIAYTSSTAQIGFINENFYRTGNNGAFQGLFLKSNNVNMNIIIYLLTVLKKQFVGYGYDTSMGDIVNLKLLLPSIDKDTPDFDYMEEYIEEIKLKYIDELEKDNDSNIDKALEVTGLSYEDLDKDLIVEPADRYEEFRVGDLFDKVDVGFKNPYTFSKTIDLSTTKNKEFELPLVNAKDGNNGIMYYGRKKDWTYTNKAIDIVSDGAVSTGNVYLQWDDTSVLYNAYLIKLKNDYLDFENKEVLLYFATVMNKLFGQIFSYTNKAGWTKVQDEAILLPAKDCDTLDFDYMEKAMRTYTAKKIKLEKLSNEKEIEALRRLI